MHIARTIRAAVLACAATALLATGPAQGAVGDSTTEAIGFTETVNKFCGVNGLRVLVEGTGSVTYRLDARGADGDVFYAERVVIDIVYTNVKTDAFVTSHENSTFRDVKISENPDGTYTVVYFGTGNAVVYDSSGTAIGRNPGQMRWEVVVDLNGTPEDFEDDEVISEEVILGSTGRNDDFCEAVVPALT